MILGLHNNWTPHQGQAEVIRWIFADNIVKIFIQCGRKWGKTELASYLLWRIAQSFPGSPCYYIAPFQKQAKEILWASNRVQTFGPNEWLLFGSEGINNTELRLRFNNGSFIKLDGSDNHQAYRGPEYKICVYEEGKDHRPEFYKAMRPNASVLNAIDIWIGTPPEIEGLFTEVAEEHKLDPNAKFKQAPSWENPHVSKSWLKEEKARLFRKGDEEEWYREYEAKFVKGGKSHIIPQIIGYPVVSYEQFFLEIERDKHHLEFFEVVDPGTSSCFAVLYIILNPYTRRIYLFDEIYETDPRKTAIRLISKRMDDVRAQFPYPERWHHIYDEAAAWFGNEMDSLNIENSNRNVYYVPTNKAATTREAGISLIKDILIANIVTITNRCPYFIWEAENYIRDKKGKIPDKNDHLLDDLRYFLNFENYDMADVPKPLPESDREDFRGAKFEDDFAELAGEYQEYEAY